MLATMAHRDSSAPANIKGEELEAARTFSGPPCPTTAPVLQRTLLTTLVAKRWRRDEYVNPS